MTTCSEISVAIIYIIYILLLCLFHLRATYVYFRYVPHWEPEPRDVDQQLRRHAHAQLGISDLSVLPPVEALQQELSRGKSAPPTCRVPAPRHNYGYRLSKTVHKLMGTENG
jgi:hypothetical protein